MSSSDFHGRRYWEFDPEGGTEEERAQVEKARHDFTRNRFKGVRSSSNLLMRMQFIKENGGGVTSLAGDPEVENPTEGISEEFVTKRLRNSIDYFSALQAQDGHWPSDLTGVLSVGPYIIIALYITGDLFSFFSCEHQKELKRYIYNHQNEDGGWGSHTEDKSTMFGTVINYVAYRLLGVEVAGEGDESMAAARGRKWILDHGGAVGIPSWGKYWLAFLGVYDWSGCNPVPPEIWLLPSSFPINPGQLLSFCRLVYLPISYLFGKRFVSQITNLVLALREELYVEPYHKIDWSKACDTCAKEDQFREVSPAVKWACRFYRLMEPMLTSWPGSILRERALKDVSELIHYEDINSHYLCIATAEKILSLLACWVEDPKSEAYKYHLPRIHDYLWIAEDGMTMMGNLSQLWDVTFAVQAIIASGLTREYRLTLVKAFDYIKKTQIHENPSGDFVKMYRHATKGSWSFMDLDHLWPVSDCTAEGLKTALMLSQVLGMEFNEQYAYDAANSLLSYQSANGGFPAWEPRRAFRWVEMLNPVEFYEDNLIEREYTECTSSALQALLYFSEIYPEFRKKDVQKCISKAISYIENSQWPDGSWYGRWGVCFTYATWLAVDGLVACGRNYHNSPCLQKACSFLLSKQLPCGGWGESHLSCHFKVYTNLEGDRAHVVQTAWALLALIKAGQAEKDPAPIHRGVKVLINFQMADGDFPQQESTGAFMRYGTLNYSSYRNIFAIWALAEYTRLLNGQTFK